MGRGKHQLTKDKKEIKSLTKIAIATKRAEKELDKKDFWKNLPVEIKDAILKTIENTNLLDVAAVGALTIILKPIVQKIPDLANHMAANIPFGVSLAIDAIQEEKIIILQIKNPFTGEVLWEYSIPNPTGQDIEIPEVPPIADLNAYIFSFCISILIVKFGPSILASSGGLQGLAKIITGGLPG